MSMGGSNVGEPWEKQETETTRAYAALRTYLELGPTRSLRAAAGAFYGEDPPGLGKVRQMERWSAEHGWHDRAEAWDAHQLDLRRQEHEDKLREMAQRHARASTALIGEALENLRLLRDRRQRDEEVYLAPRDLLRWLEGGAKLERLARGEAGERVEHHGAEGGPLQVVLRLPEQQEPDVDRENPDEQEEHDDAQ